MLSISDMYLQVLVWEDVVNCIENGLLGEYFCVKYPPLVVLYCNKINGLLKYTIIYILMGCIIFKKLHSKYHSYPVLRHDINISCKYILFS